MKESATRPTPKKPALEPAVQRKVDEANAMLNRMDPPLMEQLRRIDLQRLEKKK